MNFASTTWISLTGVVMSVSKVPLAFSWAKVRMVITGATINSTSQKNSVCGNFSVNGRSYASPLSKYTTVSRLAPSSSCTPAMIT